MKWQVAQDALADDAAWDAALVDASARDFQQFSAYGHVMTQNAGVLRRLICFDGNVPVARLQIVRQRLGPICLDYALRGPVFALDAQDPQLQARAMAALAKHARPARLRPIVLAPTVVPGQKWRQVMTGETEAIWHLNRDANALMAGMKQKWRNRLNGACASALRVTSLSLSSKRGRVCLDNEIAQRAARGYKGLPAGLPWSLKGHTGALCATAFEARERSETLATAVLLRFGQHAFYYSGWANDLGRKRSAQSLVLFRAAEHLAADGVVTLNLGTIDTVRAPGLARFKLGTGAATRPLPGTFV